MTIRGGGRAGRIDARLPVLLVVAGVLALVAWQVAISWREAPVRTALTMHRSLMPDLRFAEFVRTTERVIFGGTSGQRHSVEADPRDGAQAVGVLSRPDERPRFAWLVGQRPGFFVDVVEPVDRTLAFVLAAATDEPQKVTILFNGHDLGTAPLRRDNRFLTVRASAPADVQVTGRNRIQLDFAHVQEQQVEGESSALPIAASLRIVRFLLPEEEVELAKGDGQAAPVNRARLETSDDRERGVSELILPGGTSVHVATLLPDEERVVLHLGVTKLDLPLEIWGRAKDAPPSLLLRAEPGASGAGSVSVDLSAWVGGHVRLDLLVPNGSGRVHLKGLALLVPEGPDAETTGDATDAVTGDPTVEQPFLGRLDVLRDGALPLLAWTEGRLCLVLDLASRRRQLFDLDEDVERTRDISFTRPAATAWLSQELCRALNNRESTSAWASELRSQFRRP